MIEKIVDIRKHLFELILKFNDDKLSNFFSHNIKKSFENLIFQPLDPKRTFYRENDLQFISFNKMSNSIAYQGEMQNGKRHGFGIEYYKDTENIKYKGKFDNDTPNGAFCHFYDINGFLIYLGDFKQGEPCRGVFYYPSSNIVKYIGSFIDYKLHGKNCHIFTYIEDLLANGEFKFGQTINENFEMYYPSGCLLYKGSQNDNYLNFGVFYHDGLYKYSQSKKVLQLKHIEK